MSAECQACTSSTTDGVTLCSKCAAVLKNSLGSVGWLVAELQTTIVRLARFTRQSGTARSATTPLPWNDKASRKLRVLHARLLYWAGVIAALDNEDPLDGIATTEELARWLWRNASVIRRYDDAGELHHDIVGVVATAVATIDRPADVVTYGMCGNTDQDETGMGTRAACDAYLYGAPDETVIECGKCRASYTVSERKAWMLDYVGGMVGTASEVATYLRIAGVKVTTEAVRQMKKRKRISSIGQAKDGDRAVDLYRFSDVITAVSDRYKKSGRCA